MHFLIMPYPRKYRKTDLMSFEYSYQSASSSSVIVEARVVLRIVVGD